MSDITSEVPLAPRPTDAITSPLAGNHVRAVPSQPRQLRLWPGVVILVLQWAISQAPNWLAPGTFMQFMGLFWGPILGALGLFIWWMFFSRIRWFDRILGLLAIAVTGAITLFLSDPTMRPMPMPMPWTMNALPTATTAFVVWLLLTRSLRMPLRLAGLWVVCLVGWGFWDLLRFDGVDGSFAVAWNWRWSPTPEQNYLAERASWKSAENKQVDVPAGTTIQLQPGDWPGFRGPARDGRRTGIRIATDWEQNPPRSLWRHRVGPGWSSFAVVGNRVYTQEQHDKDEVVVCYDSKTGDEVWVHKDAARFTEAVAGPGPRATPTFHASKIYAMGAAGRLNCLDAVTGKSLWSADLIADSGAKLPTWGFASSPLVVQGVVTVFAGGPDKSVLGYDAESGKLQWSAGDGKYSYCSLHPATLGGVEQVVIATDQGLTSFDPKRGTILWKHAWPLQEGMARCVQPTVLSDSDLLVGFGFGIGTRRVHVSHKGDEWTTEEIWTSKEIKPYYNDHVIHEGHLYGFDGNMFTCVSLEDGKGKWKARGYGNGQVLLLADQGLLLILSEKGQVALVEATPNGHKELTRFQAIEGKTWNHPVVADGKLFVRNGEEAACYQLTVK